MKIANKQLLALSESQSLGSIREQKSHSNLNNSWIISYNRKVIIMT